MEYASDKYHSDHYIHEGNCITCYLIAGEIDRLDSILLRWQNECGRLRKLLLKKPTKNNKPRSNK